MSDINRIFVVIDPTTEKQDALQHAVQLANSIHARSLHVYCGIFHATSVSEGEALKRVEITRHRLWIDSLLQRLRDELSGIEVEIEVEWTSNWRNALAPAAQRCEADLIVKAAGSHWKAGRRLLKTADWTLLRQAHCPVYLSKGNLPKNSAKILLALDLKTEDEPHLKLNDLVIALGQSMAKDIDDSALYAVNTYCRPDRFVYPSDLAERVGIPKQRAHAVEGPTARLVADVANDIEADLLIVGSLGREGAKAALLGNTAEDVLDAISANLLIVMPQTEGVPA